MTNHKPYDKQNHIIKGQCFIYYLHMMELCPIWSTPINSNAVIWGFWSKWHRLCKLAIFLFLDTQQTDSFDITGRAIEQTLVMEITFQYATLHFHLLSEANTDACKIQQKAKKTSKKSHLQKNFIPIWRWTYRSWRREGWPCQNSNLVGFSL